MNGSDETRQQLWELIYDLLPAEEAEALRGRIAANPVLARAYAEARLRADLVAAAARQEEARLTLRLPEEETQQALPEASGEWSLSGSISVNVARSDSVSATGSGSTITRRADSLARVVTWLAALAVCALVVWTGLGYARIGAPWAGAAAQSEREDLAQNYVRVLLAGPGSFSPNIEPSYAITTLALDGAPVSTSILYRVLDAEGRELLRDEKRTDDAGTAQVALTGEAARAARALTVSTPEEDFDGAVVAKLNENRSDSWKESGAAGEAAGKWYLAELGSGAGEKLDLNVRSAPSGNLLVTADNNGRQVGQQALVLSGESGASNGVSVSLPLYGNVTGATRVTLFDFTVSPPAPLAEQLYFVESDQKLRIHRSDEVEVYAPGEEVQLHFQVTSDGEPAPADLRVAVVADSELASDRFGARVSVLGLGLEAGESQAKLGAASPAGELFVLNNPLSVAAAPVVLDNLPRVRSAYERALKELDGRRETRARFLGWITLAAAALLLAGVLLAAGMRLLRGAVVFVPFGALAAACLAIGLMWTTARVDEAGHLAYLSLRDRSQPALADEREALHNMAPANLDSESAPTDGVALSLPEGPRSGVSSSTAPPSGAAPGEPLSAEEFPAPKGGGIANNELADAIDPAGALPQEPAPRRSILAESLAVKTYEARTGIAVGEDGRTTVSFRLPEKPGVYYLFVEGRSGNRLGLYRGKITSRPAPAASQEP